MKKTALLILLILVFSLEAQIIELQPNSIISIDALSANMEATSNNQNLQCDGNPPDDVIDYFVGPCGGETCGVDENVSFNLQWKVSAVNDCFGTDGTNDWQVTLPPFNGAAGIYTKTVSGITDDTTYTLNCNPPVRMQNFTFNVESVKAQKFTIADYSTYIFQWIGQNIHIIQVQNINQPGNVEHDGSVLPDNIYPFMYITSTAPNEQLETYGAPLVNSGRCDVLGTNNKSPQINVSTWIDPQDTCKLEAGSYWLVWVQLRNDPVFSNEL